MADTYPVPDQFIKLADSCMYGYTCKQSAKCGEREICKAVHANGITILETKKPATCNYRKTYAHDTQICACPVRGFLFKEYKI